MKLILSHCVIFEIICVLCYGLEQPPNIVMILADDMGSNDVSYRGSNQFTTPNIDALGYNGIILNRHYTEAICTPSRAALLTGQYPIRTRMQGLPLMVGTDGYLPVGIKTLPELLKERGYSTHLVGKWHLGAARRRDTPTERGFDSHYGYWNGQVGYFDYIVPAGRFNGFDLKDKFVDAWKDQGKYATDLFTDKAVQVIENQNKTTPMFLMVAHLAVHTGKDHKVEVKDEEEMNERFGYIEDYDRRIYADALVRLDDSVGRIVDKLQQRDMLKNSIVIFMSDNGAKVVGQFHNGGSNYPLRGEKCSLHEGGIRNAAVIYSSFLEKTNYVNDQLIHITDWLPTIYGIAGGNIQSLSNLDGLGQWQTLSKNESSPRKEILLNINEVSQYSGLIGTGGRYKLLNGTYLNGTLDTFGPDPTDAEVPKYNVSAVINSLVNNAIRKSRTTGKIINSEIIEQMRNTASALRNNRKCRDSNKRKSPEICNDFCLFDLLEDPCETTNLIADDGKTEIVGNLKMRLGEFWKQVIPQNNFTFDLNSNPMKYNGTWCTWLDDELCVKTPIVTF